MASPGRPGFRAVIGRYLPDLIFGAADGIITTLAVVSGVAGAGLSPGVAVVLGLANLIADGFSMGASNVLSRRSDPSAEHPSLAAASRNGLATFFGFVVAGAVPLLAYVLPAAGGSRFPVAAAIALATLFAIGALRALLMPRNWLLAGLEMAAIGAIATAIAYSIGLAAEALLRSV